MDARALPVPRYGSASLADLLPAVLVALGVPGERSGLDLQLGELDRVVLLVVDGLGAELLRRHADAAPFLSSLAGQDLTAGFPTTTVTSLSSLGTGLPPGEHGLTGYTSWVPTVEDTVAWLSWTPVRSTKDLRGRLVPEQLQPRRTAFERAAADGVDVGMAAPVGFAGSGLTRAVLRGARFPGAVSHGDVVAQVAEGARRGSRHLGYCYAGEVDLVGHVRGPGSDAWCEQLSLVDTLAERIAHRLPSDATLLVTADHGMVTVAEDDKVDQDASSALREGVAVLAGEPRARHVHAVPGAAQDVLSAWRAELGGRAWVLTRDEVVDAGLLGPVVTADARARVGDVVAVARDGVAVVQRRRAAREASLRGHHGALTDDELLVPLVHT